MSLICHCICTTVDGEWMDYEYNYIFYFVFIFHFHKKIKRPVLRLIPLNDLWYEVEFQNNVWDLHFEPHLGKRLQQCIGYEMLRAFGAEASKYDACASDVASAWVKLHIKGRMPHQYIFFFIINYGWVNHTYLIRREYNSLTASVFYSLQWQRVPNQVLYLWILKFSIW